MLNLLNYKFTLILCFLTELQVRVSIICLVGNTPANGVNEFIDLLFEYVRRSDFPSCPSRFQSIFASENVNQAIRFGNKFGKSGSFLIWEVESDVAFKADMRLLDLPKSLLVLSYNAFRYWSGIPGENMPIWEYLMVPPVRVIRKVDQFYKSN